MKTHRFVQAQSNFFKQSIEKETHKNDMANELQAVEKLEVIPGDTPGIYGDQNKFETALRAAESLAKSDLVPQEYRNKHANVLIALDMADRLQANPLGVMQSLYIVHGKPSWSGAFIAGMINGSGRFSPLRFEFSGGGDNRECKATCRDLKSGEDIEGPTVSIKMAKAEGWYQKKGSKWQTMPDLMLTYRAATFFGRVYASDLLLGIPTSEEVEDIQANQQRPASGLPDFGDQPVTDAEEVPTEEPEKEEPATETKSTADDPVLIISQALSDAGLGFAEFKAWMIKSKRHEGQLERFDEIDEGLLKRLSGSTSGMIRQIKQMKGDS